jgi:hypothetical protein
LNLARYSTASAAVTITHTSLGPVRGRGKMGADVGSSHPISPALLGCAELV